MRFFRKLMQPDVLHTIPFPEADIKIAESQDEYFTIHAWKAKVGYQQEKGLTIFCWKIPFWKRVKLLFTGRLWHSVYTFNQPLQPICMSADDPFAPREFPKGAKWNWSTGKWVEDTKVVNDLAAEYDH